MTKSPVALLDAPLALALFAATSVPASADSAAPRDFNANRPGLGTPPTTMAPGAVMVEAGVLGWDHSSDAGTIDDTLTAADLMLRLGITERSELQFGFTSYVHDRTRDRASGAITSSHSTGDATVSWRRGLAGPNGPVAVEGFVTLPIGKSPGGAGDWGAGVLLPMSFNLPAGFQLGLTPEADAAVNASGAGRHLAFGSVAGISHSLGTALTATVEASLFRDEEPGAHETQSQLAASLAWQVSGNFQLDVEADTRLAGGVPDRSLMVGFARRIR